jgi:fructose-bisphosphate aldolase class II/tagatose 1,6-diphosphate aldolase GatY/KbaY
MPAEQETQMLVTTKDMLLDAQKGHYAVGAFNVENLEFVMAVLAAAEERHSPVIMQTTPGTVKYAGLDYFYGMVKAAAERTDVPVALHLDHGDGFDRCMQALRVGYTSVMIDGSHVPFEQNMELTESVAKVGLAMGVPVEAELGKVGGKEDDGPDAGKENPFTDPDEAVEFVERTGCTSLAVGVGTAHGVYKGTPHIEQGILKQIRAKVSIPLVLHGTSGVPDDQVFEAIENGICKVNYATELRQAFTRGYMGYMAENPDCFDPKKPAKLGMAEITAVCKSHMDNLGSTNKA